MRRSRTQPEFDFAYTDPTKDYDVSYHMHNSGGVEMGITKVWEVWRGVKCGSWEHTVGLLGITTQ